jgi:glycosyltransferase involved in cell wall biosynthesis
MKTKLLIIFKNIDGGTGTYLKALLEVRKLFNRTSLKIKVLVLEYPLYRSQEINKFSFYSKKEKHSTKYKFLDGYRLIKEIEWFKGEVGNFNPDVVISEDLHSIFITEVTKLFFNKTYRTINLIYNNTQKVIEYKIPIYLRWLVKVIISFCLNKSFLVATVSKKLSLGIYNFFGLKRTPTTIGTALPQHNYYNQKGNFTKMNNTVISIARFDNQKDHETLLKAFVVVKKQIPDARLWLVGDGPLKNKFEKMSVELGLSKHVKFYGWVQNPSNLLVKSNVFVLSTKWEGFGLVILEAMSFGIPVIASDCNYGPSEITGNNKYGILTSVGNVSSLAKSIIRLLTDHDLNKKYSNLGYNRSKEFSQDYVLPQYKKVILLASENKLY